MSEVIIGMLRLRLDTGNTNVEGPHFSLMSQLIHLFAQKAETSLEKDLLEQCPDPQVGARVHPFMKTSRLKGNTCLQQSLVNRFASRGGGFVTTKDMSLESLGIVCKNSKLAVRTSSEFSTRILMKSSEKMEESISTSKLINFCFDAAHVSEQHVTWHLKIQAKN